MFRDRWTKVAQFAKIPATRLLRLRSQAVILNFGFRRDLSRNCTSANDLFSANPAGGSAWIEWPVLRRLLSPTAVPQSFEYSIRSPQATPRLLPAPVGVAARGTQCEAIVPGQYLDV